MVDQLGLIGCAATGAVTPRPEHEFGVGVPGQCRLEVRGAVAVVVVHLGHVLHEQRLRLTVATHPVLIDLAIGVIVFAIDMILIQTAITVVVNRVHRSVVDVVVRSAGIAHAGEQRAGRPQGGTPLELVIAIQVDSIAPLVNLLVDIGKRRDPGHGVVAQVLAPSARSAVLPRLLATVYLAVVAVAVNVEHRHEVDLARVHQIGDPLLREVLVHAQVSRSTRDSVAVAVLI